MATANAEIEFVFISKDELKAIITAAVKEALADRYAPVYPIVPQPETPGWWQSPYIQCGISEARVEGTAINESA